MKICAQPLARHYDCAMLDLDGVVYVGKDAVAGAPEVLARARQFGARLAFVTNNASRPRTQSPLNWCSSAFPQRPPTW